MRPRALVFIGIALALGWAGFRLWLILGGVVPPAPAFSDVRAGYRASDLLLLDRHGEVIQEVRTDPRRRRLGWTPLDEISPALRSAVLASEDRRFFAHGGVDGRAVVAAGLQRIAGGHLRGASTITMQLATLLDPELRRRGGPADAPPEVAADAARVANRGRVAQGRDPRGLPEPRELPRRARGRGGGLERAVRRGAARRRRGGGRRARGAAPGAQCRARGRRAARLGAGRVPARRPGV